MQIFPSVTHGQPTCSMATSHSRRGNHLGAIFVSCETEGNEECPSSSVGSSPKDKYTQVTGHRQAYLLYISLWVYCSDLM